MGKAMRVLIVDDEAAFAESLADILSAKGFETMTVNSGEGAIKKFEEMPFDVALMDIKMPIQDGLETYRAIKKIRPETTVIMMTAFSVETLITEALKEGAYGVVYKPLDIDKVVKMVERTRQNGALIMVVDDDPNTRETMKDILEDKGYFVTLAKDGEEAVKMAQERPEDIVFIDMKLPVLNGLETYLSIKKNNPKATAVMMTGYRQEMKDLVEQALNKGAYTCLYKPFKVEEIVGLIKEIQEKKEGIPGGPR